MSPWHLLRRPPLSGNPFVPSSTSKHGNLLAQIPLPGVLTPPRDGRRPLGAIRGLKRNHHHFDSSQHSHVTLPAHDACRSDVCLCARSFSTINNPTAQNGKRAPAPGDVRHPSHTSLRLSCSLRRTTSSNRPKDLLLVSWGSGTRLSRHFYHFFSVFPGEICCSNL